MAEQTKAILSACITSGSKLPDLSIKDGQLIFVKDKNSIALDFNGRRVFYNQIVEVTTDSERLGIVAPISGIYYFVSETAVLWTYRNKWVQITAPPQEVIHIGNGLPETGITGKLYIDKNNQSIFVWNEQSNHYIKVADATSEISNDEIMTLFD